MIVSVAKDSGAIQIREFWNIVSRTTIAGSLRLSGESLNARVAIVHNLSANDLLIGPSSGGAVIPLPAGTAYQIPYCGFEFDLYDWWVSDTGAGGNDVATLFAQTK